MKLKFTLLVLFYMTILFSCNKENTKLKIENIPLVIQNNFRNTYSEVADASWKMEGTHFEVKFYDNELEQTIRYDMNGNTICTESETEINTLPEKIVSYISTNFENFKIKEASTMKQNKSEYYKIEITKGIKELEFLFDIEGNFVSKSLDDSETTSDEIERGS